MAASINGSVNGSTGKTPHYIIFGCDKRLPYDLLAQRPVPVYPVDDYAKKQLNVFTSIHTSVRENLQAPRAEMMHRQHQRAHGFIIDIGDSVMKNLPERQSKIAPKFSGPYFVLEKVLRNKFKLLDPKNNVTEIVHLDRLKRVHLPCTEAQSRESNTKDSHDPPAATNSDDYRLKLRSARHHR